MHCWKKVAKKFSRKELSELSSRHLSHEPQTFDKENSMFFHSIGRVIDKYKFSHENIFNIDGTGMFL